MSTDERRARALYEAGPQLNSGDPIPWDHLTLFHKDRFLARSRAIRASDEAAGMVLVPRGILMGLMASLEAAISLLERGGKKAAPSNKMFDQMLADYKKDLDAARAMLAAATESDNG